MRGRMQKASGYSWEPEGEKWLTAPRSRAISSRHSEEEEARSRKRGLWVDEALVPPWEWREGDRATL